MPGIPKSDAERAAVGALFNDADVARCYAHRPPYAAALFEFLLERTAGRGRALDLGCGPGKVALALAEHFAEVTALDPAAHMIEAGRRADAGRHANIAWVNIRAEDLAPGQSFDLVTAGTAIHWPRHDILFPKLAAITPMLAVISEGGPEYLARGLGKPWVEFHVRWLARVGQVYDQAAFNADGRRYESWMDIAGRERFAYTFRQSVEDFITSQHSRATWARSVMGEALADEFDRDLEALMRPYAKEGLLEFELVSELTWGAPRSEPV